VNAMRPTVGASEPTLEKRNMGFLLLSLTVVFLVTGLFPLAALAFLALMYKMMRDVDG
jgi:hypothetical protein